jgi:hypothetical protein
MATLKGLPVQLNPPFIHSIIINANLLPFFLFRIDRKCAHSPQKHFPVSARINIALLLHLGKPSLLLKTL